MTLSRPPNSKRSIFHYSWQRDGAEHGNVPVTRRSNDTDIFPGRDTTFLSKCPLAHSASLCFFHQQRKPPSFTLTAKLTLEQVNQTSFNYTKFFSDLQNVSAFTLNKLTTLPLSPNLTHWHGSLSQECPSEACPFSHWDHNEIFSGEGYRA